jgi:hypothetical protein
MSETTRKIEEQKLWAELRKLERSLNDEFDSGIRKVIKHRIEELKRKLSK